MNGVVNGTMEEPMETSHPSTPLSPEPHKTVEAQDCEKKDICSVASKSSDKCNSNREPDQGIVSNSNVEKSEKDVNNECVDQLSKDKDMEKCNLEDEDCIDAQSNPCKNNNGKQSESEGIENDIEPADQQKISDKSQGAQAVNSKHEYLDELDDSSDDDSAMSSEQKGDTISMNSSDAEELDETSQESQAKSKDGDIINLDNYSEDQNGDYNDSSSSDIQEILSDNDDCIIENDDKSNTSINSNLHRSSRTTTKKSYADIENGDCESDVEEVEMKDPLSCNTNPIVIKDTKSLVEMAAKHKSNNNNQKEPTVVIIDSKSGKGATTNSKAAVLSTKVNVNAQNLYQSIVARGTTVTPVSVKSSSAPAIQSSHQNSQPLILPTLTDDMFVVEVPSFIVPYVYEKPSIKDFREFIDQLGKELEEQKAKEEQERLEKEKQDYEKKENAKKLMRERGEVVVDSEDDSVNKTNDSINKTNDTIDDDAKKKKSKKDRKRKRDDDDDASWDGDSSSDSEEETLSDDDTVVLKEKMDSIEEIKDVTNLSAQKVSTSKSDNYFDCSLGNFFINIGLNMVQEYVQHDLLKQQNRKLYREKKAGHSTKAVESSIVSLTKNLEFSKENNAPYKFSQKKCEFCSFKTESDIVMSHHLETPHMKNNVYKCNFCAFEIRSPHDILFHMEAEHNVRGKLERAPAYHQCPNCPFEDNGKGKLARHQIACAKKFKPDLNLAPPIEWEPPAKIPKIASARNAINSYQNVFNRHVNMTKAAMGVASLMASGAGGYRPRGRSPMGAPPRSAPVPGAPLVRGGLMVRHNAPSPALMGANYPVANNGKPKSMHQPSISITPLPRQPQPAPQVPQSKNTFVICEICDGYIKDLEQLRNHMQWIHKVRIHPKMIYNRPPLNCQKCQFRFFTDQGLERHLLGSHGLVTSSMQEAANKGKDAGRCPVCGRVYQWKLLSHVAKDHQLTLKPAHLSYKCTVCTATFGMYKQFENHVYSAHSVVAKRVMDKSKPSAPPPKPADSLLKPLKINDEITIIPQPIKPTTSAKGK